MSGCRSAAFLLVLALLCLLPACAERPQSEAAAERPAASSERAPAEKAAAHPLRACDTQVDGGYYLGEDRGPYGNTTYIDFESARQVYVCARPECTHDSEECTSYGVGSTIFYVVNDRIYTIRTRTDDYGPPEAFSQALDGSDWRDLVQFPANYQLDSRIYTDDAALYILADVVGKDSADVQRELLRVDLADGSWESLYTFPPEFMISFIAGTTGRCLIFDVFGKGETGTYRFLDVDRRAFAEEPEQRFNSPNPSVWYGGKLHEILAEEELIRITDPATGEVQEVSWAPVYTVPGFPAFRHDVNVFEDVDGVLRLELQPEDASDNARYEFHLFLDSSKVKPFTLFVTYKPQPIIVMAKQDGVLLVLVDYKQGPSDDPLIYNYTPQYALIRESDYLANNPAYRPVQSDFYPDAWA